MPSIRQANMNKAINRTVTLPAWLNAMALEHNINFSQTLQDALKTTLRSGNVFNRFSSSIFFFSN